MGFALTRPIRFAKQDSDRDQFDLLWYLGYFDEYSQNRSDAERERVWGSVLNRSMWSEVGGEAVKAYQRFIGLKVDGDFGPKTKDALKKRFCSVPDVRFHPSEQRAAAGRPRWPMDRVTFTIVNDSGVLVPFSLFEAAINHTIKAWNSVCGIQLETWQEGEPGPHIYGYSRRIDGSSGTLAWSQLAWAGMPASSQLEQRYDQENWAANNLLDPVVCHEVGHALGMDHISSNFAKALMNPFADPNVRVPQPADVAVMRGYYGDPKPTEPDPPVDPTNAPRVRLIWSDGERWVGPLHKAKAGEGV